jgi:hypothetical protein
MVARRPADKPAMPDAITAKGGCVCGAVRFAIVVPAVWAWHDHSAAGRRAHGGAYATYVGTWKSRLRMIEGEDYVARYQDPQTRATRSFCAACGTPLFYERAHAPKMVNIPRGVFRERTGREPRYHLAVGETADWEYASEPLSPLKGYPGVMWSRPRRRPRRLVEDLI